MEKLKDLKKFHLGIGILILLIQLIFQLSTAIYLFGLTLMLFSVYESLMVKKLTFQKGKIERVRAVLNSYKWVCFFAILPIVLIAGNIMMDLIPHLNITEMIFSNQVFFINVLVVSGVATYLSIKFEIGKMERALMEDNI